MADESSRFSCMPSARLWVLTSTQNAYAGSLSNWYEGAESWVLKLIPHQLSEEMNDRFLPNLRNVFLCFGGVLPKELPASSIEHGSPSRYIRRTECGFSCPIRRTLLEAGRLNERDRISSPFSETCIIAIDKKFDKGLFIWPAHCFFFCAILFDLFTRKGGQPSEILDTKKGDGRSSLPHAVVAWRLHFDWKVMNMGEYRCSSFKV